MSSKSNLDIIRNVILERSGFTRIFPDEKSLSSKIARYYAGASLYHGLNISEFIRSKGAIVEYSFARLHFENPIFAPDQIYLMDFSQIRDAVGHYLLFPYVIAKDLYEFLNSNCSHYWETSLLKWPSGDIKLFTGRSVEVPKVNIGRFQKINISPHLAKGKLVGSVWVAAFIYKLPITIMHIDGLYLGLTDMERVLVLTIQIPLGFSINESKDEIAVPSIAMNSVVNLCSDTIESETEFRVEAQSVLTKYESDRLAESNSLPDADKVLTDLVQYLEIQKPLARSLLRVFRRKNKHKEGIGHEKLQSDLYYMGESVSER